VSDVDRVTYIGHSTVLIELDGLRVLTDPVLRSRVGHLRRHAPPPDPETARRLDAVLVSHRHMDHLDLPSLRRLNADAVALCPRGAGRSLRRAGLSAVTELDIGASASIGSLTVRGIEAQHDGRRLPVGAPAPAIGFEITSPQRRVYFAGDTDLFDAMAELAGDLDVALLPVAGWGPTVGPGHLDPQRAAQAVARLQPRVAIPIHWGTLAVAGSRSTDAQQRAQPAREFAQLVAQATPSVTVAVLEPGASLELESSS
jgi:L-ascorbate metabolism protein UlaG (beta-lactamase superfamily)